MKKKLETSKRILYVVVFLYGLSMAAAYVLPILFRHMGTTA